MPKVSVIVPIYNVEKFLRRCLDSLVNQTLKDIEIILVNDASPDNSHIIMREYAENFKNIRCIYLKENQYQGGARNRGIKVSKGEYITFVDSDDYIDVTMLEKMYNKIKETNSDFVYCHFNIVDEEGNFIKENVFRTKELEGKLTDESKKKIFKERAVPCGHLYKRNLWIDNNIIFPKHLKFEDVVVMPLVILYSQSCACVLEPLYYYVKNEKSTNNLQNSKNFKDVLIASDLLLKQMHKRGFYEKYKEELEMSAIVHYGLLLTKCVGLFDKIPLDVMLKARRYMKKNFPQYKKSKYYLTTTGEERILMVLNYIHPQLAYFYQNNLKVPIMNFLGKKTEALIYYRKYYKKYYERIIELFKLLKERNLKTAIYGASMKKYALMYVLGEQTEKYINYNMADREKNKLDKNEVLVQDVLDDIDIVYVVNPSFIGSMYRNVRSIEKEILVVNLEDYINGFISCDYFKKIIQHITKIKS